MDSTKERVFTSGREYENISMRSNEWCFIDDRNSKHRIDKKNGDGWGKYFEPIPDTPAKYKLLRPITGRSLLIKGPDNCHEFDNETVEFIGRYGLHTCATTFFDSVDEYAAQVKAPNLKWLLVHGYLERVKEERTYCAGQRVKIKGFEYGIVPVGWLRVQLIATGLDTHYNKPVTIADFKYITQAEMDKMVLPKNFQGVVDEP